jgi:cob(I)alamin adenosyltransferase
MNAHYKDILAEIQDRLHDWAILNHQKKRGIENGELRLQKLGILDSDELKWQYGTDLPQMTHFVLPGGHPTVSHSYYEMHMPSQSVYSSTFKP